MLITAVIVATILAFAGYLAVGRFAGLSITALCGVSMAFFLMPPIFSIRVSQSHDIVALAFYGAGGLVLARSAPKKRRALVQVRPISDLGVRKRVETDLSCGIADVISSDLGVRLRALDFDVATGGVSLPCTPDETRRILSDVLTAALQTPGVERVSVYGGQGPSIRRLIVVAHYVWPPPQGKVIIVGKRDEDCERATFPRWPLHSRASWFDNGYERIYQISVEIQR